MILINNRQRKIKINTKKLQHNAQIILDALKYPDFDLGILLTTNKAIQKYNAAYRNKDKPTDILSFPHHPELQAGKRIKIHSDDDKNLGDLILSLEYIQKAANDLAISFEEHMKVLLVHGICHLLGYDHIKDEDYKVMRRRELNLLKLLK